MATINGDGGDNSLYGTVGDDTIDGKSGNDTIEGGAGDDSLSGGSGDDIFVFSDGFGSDSISGGAGGQTTGDVLDLSGTTSDVTVTFTDNEDGTLSDGTDTATFSEIENVVLGEGDDSLEASAVSAPVSVDAGDGADVITGSIGNDTVTGGDGGDTLSTSGGDDIVYGGAGDDVIATGQGDGGSAGSTQQMSSFTFDVTNISEVGSATGPGDTGSYIVYDDVGVTQQGVEVQAKITVVSLSDSDLRVELGYADYAPVMLNRDFAVSSGESAEIRVEFFNQETGEPVPLDGAFTFQDLDSTSESVTIGKDDALNVFTSADPVSNISITDNGDDITLNTAARFNGDSDDEENWATVEFASQQSLEFEVTSRGGTTFYDFGTRFFSETPIQTGLINDDDTVDAGSGNDYVDAGAGADSINAGTGNDTVNAGSGEDTVLGDSGNDTLDAGAGNDTLTGGTGDDVLSGGTGNDTYFGGDDQDTISIDADFGNDTITGGEGGTDVDTLDLSAAGTSVTVTYTADEAGTFTDGEDTGTFAEIEKIVLTDKNDTLDHGTTTGNITVDAGDGYNTITTGDGDDSITGGDQGNYVVAGDGDNTISVGDGTDVVNTEDGDDSVAAGDGNDVIQVGEGENTVSAGAGNDYISAGNGNDTIDAGDGNDTLISGSGNDSFGGGDGADSLVSGQGEDLLDGGDGNDILSAGEGDDTVSGGGGDDTVVLEYGFGNDTITGGETGETDGDTLDLSGLGNGVSVTFDGPESGTVVAGSNTATFAEIENIILSDAGDSIDASGMDAPMTIEAGGGNDTVAGSDGDDTLIGGTGDDTFVIMDGGGDDVAVDFGDGNDQVDTSDLDDSGMGAMANGTVTADEVSVTGGSGNPQTLHFPDGETFEVPDGTIDKSSPGSQFASLVAIGVPACFAPGTLIQTDQGERPVETLRPGDLVVTADHGLQPLRLAISRAVDFLAPDNLRGRRDQPVKIAKGSLSRELPRRDLIVSPQHRMVVSGVEVADSFGTDEVLAIARSLTTLRGIRTMKGRAKMTYHALLFDRHEIIFAEGAPTESFRPGPVALASFSPQQRAAVYRIYPDLADDPEAALGPPARPMVTRRAMRQVLRKPAVNA